MSAPVDELKNRLKKALSIRDLKPVDLVRITSIPKSAISQYMSGYAKPKQDRIFLIAKALDINEAWLLGYDVPMERNGLTYVIGENGEREIRHSGTSSNKDKAALLEEMGIKKNTSYLMSKDNVKTELNDNEYDFLINTLGFYRKK